MAKKQPSSDWCLSIWLSRKSGDTALTQELCEIRPADLSSSVSKAILTLLHVKSQEYPESLDVWSGLNAKVKRASSRKNRKNGD